METYIEIIDKIAHDLNIKVTHLSDNWITVLEKNNKIHYIEGYKFDLNSYGIASIMNDKGLFYDLCKEKNYPIIEHYVLFKDYSKEKVLDYFKKHKVIVIKGNLGTCGKEVYKVSNEKELFRIIDYLFLSQYSISLCPYYEIKNEYRVILLNKEARIIYGKVRPMVIGDGNSSLKELIDKNNYQNIIEIDNLDYVPKKNEVVYLSFKFNLSNGASMFINIEKDLKKKIEDIAVKVARELNIIFASIDIIYTEDYKLFIMEANSGVMMDNYIRYAPNGYSEAYKLYKDAICLMFNDLH